MAKLLAELFKAKAKDDRKFQDAHKVNVQKDLVVTAKDDKLYQATNVMTFKRGEKRMGNDPGADEKAYDFDRAAGVNDQETGLKDSALPVVTTAEEVELDDVIDILAEVMELDELSKATLGRYIRHAHADTKGLKRGEGGPTASDRAHNNKRSQGINRAVSKLAGNQDGFPRAKVRHEEVDEIINLVGDELELDELSKKTLASYVTKASISAADHARASAGGFTSQKTPAVGSHLMKAFRRLDGIKKAANKLAKPDGQSRTQMPYHVDKAPDSMPVRFAKRPK